MYYLNTTCPSGYHHNGFMATGALGTPMYYTFSYTNCDKAIAVMTVRVCCVKIIHKYQIYINYTHLDLQGFK